MVPTLFGETYSPTKEPSRRPTRPTSVPTTKPTTMYDNSVYVVSQSIGNVTQLYGTITLCDTSIPTGALSNCRIVAKGITCPGGIYISGNRAYLTECSTILLCLVTSVGDITNCTSTGGSFPQCVSIEISGSFAYIGNVGDPAGLYTGSISQCTVNNVDGSLSNCFSMLTGLDFPYDITINGAYAYIVQDGANNVLMCKVDGISGTFYDCASTGYFYAAAGIALDNNIGYAYITNLKSSNDSNGNIVSVCRINSNNGSLTDCYSTGSSFNNPTGIVTSGPSNRAYVANIDGNSVSVCTINSFSGALTDCSATVNSLFFRPFTLWFGYVNGPTQAPTRIPTT